MQCKAAVLFISLVPNNLLGTKLQYFGTIPPTQLKNITDLGHFKIHGTKYEHFGLKITKKRQPCSRQTRFKDCHTYIHQILLYSFVERKGGGRFSMLVFPLFYIFISLLTFSKPIFEHFSLFELISYISTSNMYFHFIPGCIQTFRQHSVQ